MLAWWNAKSSSEQLLMIFTVLVLSAAAYYFVRWRPTQQAVAKLERNIKQVELRESRMVTDGTGSEEYASLSQQISNFQDKIKILQGELELTPQQGLDPNDNMAVASLKTQIVDRANLHDLQVVSSQSEAWNRFLNGLDHRLQERWKLDAEEAGRPVEVLELIGSYDSFVDFIVEMKSMSFPPVISEWQIELNVERESGRSGPLVFRIKLVL